MKRLLLVLLLSGTAHAQNYTTCTAKDTAATCAPPPMLPPKFFNPDLQPPYDVALRFGGVRIVGNGEVFWIWLKASEPSRRCTPADHAIGRSVVRACNAKIGEEVMQSPRIKPPTTKR